MILSCSTCSLTDPFGRIENLERWRSVAHSSPLLLPLLSSGLEQDLGSFDSDHTRRFLALGLAAICLVWMIPDLRRIPDSRQVLGSTRCPTHQTEHYPSVTHVCMWRSHFMSQQLAQRQEGRRGHKKPMCSLRMPEGNWVVGRGAQHPDLPLLILSRFGLGFPKPSEFPLLNIESKFRREYGWGK